MSEQYPPNPNQPQQPGQQGMPPQWAAKQSGYGYPQAPQYGQQPPQAPFQGQGPAPYQPPPQPKKGKAGKIAGFGCLGVVALFVIIGAIGAASGGSDDSSTTADASAAAPEQPAAAAPDDDKPAAEDKPAAGAPKKDLSQADQFKAFVAKNGTPTEKSAVKHVTKVQGADESNDILDAADVYTDYTGGLMGPHQADGKLLASAFADWKDSKNGLVTVYDAKGEILSNGQY